MAIENINIRVNGTSNMGQVVAQLKAASAAANTLNASVAGMQNAWAKTGNVTSTDLGIAQSAIGNYRNEMRAAAELSGQWNTATKNLTASTTAFNEALAKNKVRLRDVRGKDNRSTIRAAMREQIALNNMVVKGFSQDATGKISADIYTPKPEALRGVKYFRQEMGYMNNILRSVSEQTLNWGKNTQWAGRQLTVGFSVPISMAITALSYFGFQLDQQMVRITKVYGDATSAYQVTDESIRNMASGTAKFVAEQYGIMGKETRDVMGELAATGREGAELQTTTAEVMRASLLGDMDTDTSLRLLRVLSEAYRLTGDELRHYVNYFNEIENSTALTMNDIAEGLPRIAGIMQATGVSLEDTVVLLTAFKEAGIDVAEGANALKSINFKAIAASPTAKNNFLRITGQDMDALIQQTNGEFLPMMQEISNAMEGLGAPERTDLIARVFGIHQGSRALTIIEQLTNGSKGMLRATEVAKMSASDLAESAAAEQKKIMSSASQQLKSMFAVAVGDLELIGGNVLKVITPLVGKIMELFSWFSKLSPSAQEFATKVALVVAAAGPLIMIVGQFGNLFGNIGKFAAVLGGLTGRFQILNPMTKAAEVLQKKLNAEQYQAANATDAHRLAMERLTLAMEQQAAVASAAIDARTNAAWSDAPISTSSYGSYQSMPVNRAPTKGGQGQFRTGSGKFAGAVPAGGALFVSDPGLQMHIPDVEVEKTKTIKENFGETFESSKKLEKSWEKNARSLAAMGGASMMVGQAFGSELLTNVGMFSMIIGAVGPGLGQIATKVAGLSQGLRGGIDNTSQLGAMVLTTGSKWDVVKSKGVGAMSSIRAAGTSAIGSITRGFGAFMGFMAGPWGLAVGAAGLLLVKLWQDNKKAAEEAEAAWENMANNSKALAEQYGFMDTSPLEIARMSTDWDEDSYEAQVMRIKDLEQSESDYYKNVMAFKKEISSINNEQVREEAAINAAISQGRQALVRGVTPEEAQRIAQDAYALITGELMNMGEFKGEFEVDVVLKDTDSAGKAVAKDVGASMNEALKDGVFYSASNVFDFNVSDEQIKIWEDQIGGALESMSMSTDIPYKQKILEDIMGGDLTEFDAMGRQFRKAIDSGLMADDSTVEDFLENYGNLTWNANLAGLTWDPISDEGITRMQLVAPLLNEEIDLTKELNDESTKSRDLTDLIFRRREGYIDKISAKELESLQKQAQAMAERSDKDAEYFLTQMLNVRIAHQQEIAPMTKIMDKMVGLQKELTAEKALTAGEEARLASIMQVNKDAAKAARDEMLEYRKAGVDALRSAWDASVDEFIGDAMSQMDDQHRAEVDARKAQGDAVIDGIEADFDQREKVADAAHKQRMKGLEAAQEREEEALDNRADSLQAAWEARRDAEKDRQEREKNNFNKRWEGIEEREEKAQENRRNNIERTYDDRIQKVQDLIEAEEASERRRQEIFDKEKQRIQRMAQMYSSGIDINMAINSGDLDEAARITNDMTSTRAGWAIDDTAENASTEAEKRRKAMGSQIEIIEGEKDARLKALDDVEKAEDEARKRRQEAAQKAMEDRFKLIDKEIEREKEKNDAIIADERELLRERYEAREQNLNDSFAKEKELRQTARDTSITIEQEKTDGAIVEIERLNEVDRKAVEKRLDILRDHTPMTAAEYQALTDEISVLFGDHNIDVKKSSKANTNEMAEYNVQKVKSELNDFMDDKVWEKAGTKITDAMIEGGLGFNMSPAEFRKFILEGELPKRLQKKSSDKVSFGPNQPIAMHTGGVIGQDSGGRTGYSGNSLSQSETMVNMLKGEGVLNLRAMRQPGMKDFVKSANRTGKPLTGDGEGMSGLFSGLIAGAIGARMTSLATMSGLEHGLSKAQNNMGLSAVSSEAMDSAGTSLNSTQLANARIILDVGRSMGATQRDLIIGLMTAMQESTLFNRDHGDRDSVGLFQQRTSQGWGSVEQIMDPQYSSRKFFTELLKDDNRTEKPLWQAADDVQRSAYPTRYAQWEGLARALVGNNATGGAGMGRSLNERWKSIMEQMSDVRAHSEDDITNLGPAGGRMSGEGLGWKKQWSIAKNKFPDAYLSSGYYGREGDLTASGWPSYHGVGRAVDLAGSPDHMMAMFNFLRSKFGSSIHELYYSPAGHRQMRQGGPHYPTGKTRANHWDHVHWAMKNGGWVPGQGYGDVTPAMLEPKEFVVNRKAAENHPHLLGAMNAGQQFAVPGVGRNTAGNESRFDNQGDTAYNVNINLHGNINKEIDFERATLRALEKLDRKRGGNRRITK